MPPKTVIKVKKTQEEKGAEERLKERIIAKVSQHPILYDKENERYFDTKEKEEVRCCIAKELGCSSVEVTKKWKSLRDAYVREKRWRDQPSGSAAVKRKPLAYYDSMTFLEPYVRKRGSISTADGDSDGGESDEDTQKSDETPASETQEMVVVEGQIFDMTKSPDRRTVEQFTEIINEVANSNPQPTTLAVHEKAKVKTQPILAILSPKKEQSNSQMKRSKAKREAELSDGMNKIVSSLESQLSQKAPSDDQEILLGQEIGRTLLQIPNKIIRNKWKRKFRNMLSDMEDEVAEMEEGGQ